MNHIVVGVDGSATGQAALQWAADQARAHGATLEVVHAFHHRSPPVPSNMGVVASLGGEVIDVAELDRVWEESYRYAESSAQQTVKYALDRVHDGVDAIDVHLTVVPGRDAREVLVDRARHADQLVVGSRGLGYLPDMVLGSVSRYCVQHAPCPVTVVPAAGGGEPD